ncbi:unnamed protein product [Durusdinium trenchii]|uniref:Pyridoxamine 5'-phosphate oxidase N-terminal domain-containing protein n=3 Tax=Durusdinium trenchii TaxID=1381693 RepID=A0ABP0NQ45_9DINO
MSLARSAAVAATSGALGLAIGSEKVQLMGGLAKVKAWLGFQAAAVDLTQPDAVLGEALSFAKATPQDCGVLSTRQGGGVASRMVQLKEPFGVQEENGDVRVNFFTSSASRKFKELLADPNCALLYWNPETLTYVTFQGRAEPKPPAEAKSFWREWMRILYKDPGLYTAWHLHVQRIQVVSIGRLESYRHDWRPVELERSQGSWKILCDGTE